MTTARILQAAEFATMAHDGQRRKYDGTPYVTHVFRVAARVAALPDEAFTWVTKENAIIVAILHDVVEDCTKPNLTADDLRYIINQKFGPHVLELVDTLTDKPKEFGNRKARKADTIARFMHAPNDAKTIKCADLLDNAYDIVYNDPNFGPRFLEEKEELLPALEGAYAPILDQCWNELVRLQQYVANTKGVTA